MKVLNLQCTHHHSFEGWFASEDDFQTQLSRDLIECPMCESTRIEKMPSAPRLNFGAHRSRADPSKSTSDAGPASHTDTPIGDSHPPPSTDIALAQAPSKGDIGGQADFLKALRHLVANTEDVGRRFADEARRMHYGHIQTRSIRGRASPREAVELLEEGIEVMPLPMSAALKKTLQ